MNVMTTLRADDPLATVAVAAIRGGDLPRLSQLLHDHPGLATARVVDDRTSRTLLHVVTDWPGHFPNGAVVVGVLVEAGADVNARFRGPHSETPLHWAASSDDVAVLDALLDAGADIDAPGGVIAGGTPLADARAFAQWRAAFRLVERGAAVSLTDAATLGLLDRVASFFPGASPADVDVAFWGACHGGRLDCARFLADHGASLSWVPPWEPLTPLSAARRSGASDVVAWLVAQGAE